jgi:hypothetical protein
VRDARATIAAPEFAFGWHNKMIWEPAIYENAIAATSSEFESFKLRLPGAAQSGFKSGLRLIPDSGA